VAWSLAPGVALIYQPAAWATLAGKLRVAVVTA